MQGSGCQLSIALYFTGNDFRRHLGFVRGLVGEHGISGHVAGNGIALQ